MTLSPERVAAASSDWVWVPDSASAVETADYLLVRFPDWFEHPAALVRFEPTGDPAATLDEAAAKARELGADRLIVWVKPGTGPELDSLFVARRGVIDEVLDILALDLAPAAPDLGTPEHLTLRWTTEAEVVRAAEEVSVQVFGGAMPPQDELAAMLERDRRTVAAGGGGIVVAYADDRPLGFGGVSVVDGVARLWGGAVLEEARGRGVYRALLAERLRYALAQGATMALVKGRVATSGPILRRAGFAPYGQERSYLLPL
ncbi:GNAT family N-acetyltransferase [Nocardioides sp. cx-169]|uniref:GNAT family N-acetyltransferase n=1 Tax=Nocardioides sp. cx-169 TaxID=2899080 RepID=UPI001E45D7D2|nr:GNAT family N-acetyltransferase [Nocardioides sp. cx-169]MCD4536047.1 GNAT family N-acetyltransferase [Nocardioides sp. cx-169]